MVARFKALVMLAGAFVFALLRKLLPGRQDGITAFRAHYDADGLPPVAPEERKILHEFQRCIACGLCDRGEAERIARSGGAYRGTMALVLAGSRSMPDYRAAAYSFSFVGDAVLAEKELICPTNVPFRKLARFVADKAAAVGGPWPLPRHVASVPPRAGASEDAK
jgi:hypothetical protein